MTFKVKDPEKLVRKATIATLIFWVCWGLVLVVAQIKPFWVDEWRVIYNLKFKTAATIWGPLDFMQQFPRLYIEIIKAFSSLFDYSYFTLRLPSFLVGTGSIMLCYRLMTRIYPARHFNRFLFVMTLVSCGTFTEYFVQIKQYTMDIFLSLVAIWQLLELLDIGKAVKFTDRKYLLLCASCLIVPSFSYTYPVAIAPVFVVLMAQSLHLLRAGGITGSRRTLLLKWLPASLSIMGIAIFYIADVSQLMHDEHMHGYWAHLMMGGGFSWSSFFLNIWNLFAEIGSGLFFWYIMGILGLASFIYSLRNSIRDMANGNLSNASLLRLYSVVLLVLSIIMFALGKLPLGEPRFNVFAIPAISLLIINLLDNLQQKQPKALAISALLYAGVIGNIYTTFIASVTGPEYAKKMQIYRSTEDAIVVAQARNLPILITPDVAYPYDKTQNLPYDNTVPGDWVLKTFPAYKVAKNIPVYPISNIGMVREVFKKLPPHIKTVMIGDGQSYNITSR